jgi:hypothetical protein
MPIEAQISKRFAELDELIDSLQPFSHSGSYIRYYKEDQWRQWATSAHYLLRMAFGVESPHCRNFSAGYEGSSGTVEAVDSLKGVFRAAKSDYEGGYAFSIPAVVSGEIYGDFVVLAKVALAEGSKDVAAVLACAALEDALKRLGLLNGLDVSTKSMQEVVSALKSQGLVTGAQKTLLDAMPKIRDYAMHANWNKITPQDVGSVIGFVEQLLLTKFS